MNSIPAVAMTKALSEMKSQNNLNVVERVNAALQMQRHESASQRISVSEICRLAGVSRANLYASHPEIVAEILGHPVGERSVQPSRKTANATLSHAASVSASEREKALLYLCLELQAEVQSLRALRIASKDSRGTKGAAKQQPR